MDYITIPAKKFVKTKIPFSKRCQNMITILYLK